MGCNVDSTASPLWERESRVLGGSFIVGGTPTAECLPPWESTGSARTTHPTYNIYPSVGILTVPYLRLLFGIYPLVLYRYQPLCRHICNGITYITEFLIESFSLLRGKCIVRIRLKEPTDSSVQIDTSILKPYKNYCKSLRQIRNRRIIKNIY